uniref:Mannose-P-dolichol utilization defect 1 protein homolog n=1 Tax=Chromera velia CCMP2878 TaxID=1169474 RepID=A0A0G4HN12_9ALVE|eukprot:Cvel_7565.t1-p1 / transcript=Cvel_7565.t1 / gene=Cvel_7565 / organism=Chromera_velia_CCMP2878 / gene_product=Mannose-P-dolichol utilization defect 1 protein, putative / transcript_product=Mannose-P-dolichol utilization defect 1 protein, putative / location=Cvel_scaffold398:36843-41886(+) / protein_length=269 / sequence_SO=supercontig / SO=protein_coding / is_pseudo=false
MEGEEVPPEAAPSSASPLDVIRKVAGYLIDGKCFDLYLSGHFTDLDCLKMLIINGLNLAMLAGGAIVKVPQLVNIFASKSVSGISETSQLIEFYSAGLTVAYNLLVGNPFKTWGEMAFITVQQAILILQYWSYAKKGNLVLRASFIFSVVGIVYILQNGLFPEEYLWALGLSPTPIIIVARMPQVIMNFQQGHTGLQSVVTAAANFLGNIARVATTLAQVDDPVMLTSYVVCTVINGVLFFQIVFYWSATKAVLAKEKKEKDKESKKKK